MRAVNLLPRDDAARALGKPSLQTQLTVAAPFVGAALLAIGVMLTNGKVNNRRAELQALQQQLAAIPKPKPTPGHRVDPRLVAEHAQRVSALAAALGGRVAWDRILREISSVLPNDVWLNSLNVQSVPAAPGTVATGPTSTLTIQGYTYSQPGVARFLARMGVVPEVSEATLRSSTLTKVDGRDVVQFEIDATVQAGGNG